MYLDVPQNQESGEGRNTQYSQGEYTAGTLQAITESLQHNEGSVWD